MSDVYRIKPLAWIEGERDGNAWATAGTVFNAVHVEQDGGEYRWRYCVDEYYDEGGEGCDSIADGKARAETWYLGRILPALEAAAEGGAP